MTDDEQLTALSALVGMPVPAEYRDGVLQQWRLNQALIAPLLAFDLPGDIPPAPVFQP